MSSGVAASDSSLGRSAAVSKQRCIDTLNGSRRTGGWRACVRSLDTVGGVGSEVGRYNDQTRKVGIEQGRRAQRHGCSFSASGRRGEEALRKKRRLVATGLDGPLPPASSRGKGRFQYVGNGGKLRLSGKRTQKKNYAATRRESCKRGVGSLHSGYSGQAMRSGGKSSRLENPRLNPTSHLCGKRPLSYSIL